MKQVANIENFSLKTSACQWRKELEFMLLRKILHNIFSPLSYHLTLAFP